ncbi:surface antigen BspA-like [Trichomonas vaginalis G3]|uniref:Surface antigen BspA-like n=1 Tax=Trichomonas vaginalis (strain ATCC PRA-98 / G3) TaxID=412133 RepID=A2DX70_TRIV3|nr:amphoterin-induced protein family [Trichomonas vaginalis G3]EAY14952.1 surface antigen BspA-like [Trichomonas vaginalis G3]KAI5507380.1 amphoterin-induced protein family [Trichomonas vaginalis G3]|eukprot:XP_001327175.1 surface antigen BspA-like [Trichomonas vaginalis G3]
MCFYDSYLESIIIPESVKRIDDDAFRDCRRMTSVKFLGPVDFFDGYIFYQCDILDLISFPDTPMIVNAPLFISTTTPKARLSFTCKTFFSSTAIERDTKVLISYINESNLIITPQLFIMKSNQTEIYEYWGLNTNIMIPKNITTIKESAFENSTISQIGFEADSQLSTIEKYAFRKCSNLSSFDFSPTLLRFLGIESFKDCIKLRSANFASNQLVVMRNAFENCNNLVNVSNIADVLENCFSGCIKLADVKIRDNAAKIAYKSFEKCYSLESIKIPSSIEIISEHAFANCVSLKSIIFSETNNLLKISFNSFSGCNSLENISNFDSDKYKCFDNTLYYKNETGIDLIFHAFNSSDKVLILNCNVICSYSFTDCNNVYNISISPNSVSLIEKFSFYSCKNLKYINFPLSVETVESNSFTDCPSLRCPLIIENITIDYLRMIVDSGIPSRLLFSCHILAGSYNIQIIKRIVSNSPSLFWKHLSK